MMNVSGKQPPDPHSSVVLGCWLADLTVGKPMRHRSLTVLPVYRTTALAPLEYAALEPAIAAGDVTVVEAEQATVPTLRVQNRSAVPILLLDGEEVVGGRQNRVVNSSLLIPPRTILDLDVTCVEQGRWHQKDAAFRVGESAYPSLRRQKVLHVSLALALEGKAVAQQGEIWNEVSQMHVRGGVRSATGAMKDAYEQRQQHLDDAGRTLPCPPDGPVGVIALVGGRARCADLFDRADTLSIHWSRLIRSYSLEAADVPVRRDSRGSAERLLSRARQAQRTAYSSTGLGTDVRLSGNGIVGAALIEAGVAVHISVFRQHPAGGQQHDV